MAASSIAVACYPVHICRSVVHVLIGPLVRWVYGAYAVMCGCVSHEHIITAACSFRTVDESGEHVSEHFAAPAAIYSEWLDH